MVRRCGSLVREDGCSECRLMSWACACVLERVCWMSMFGLFVYECVRIVLGGVACGKGVCGSSHMRVHCIGTVWL
jgi:hypothetical protein